jgi:hypothetical protein
MPENDFGLHGILERSDRRSAAPEANMRIQLDVTEDSIERLNFLRAALGATTLEDLFNTALTLLTWAISQRRAGASVCAIDPDDEITRELRMPALERVSPVGAKKAA